ncbi:MAG TPA: IPT/TIG domain-containing protein, partial [Acidimicrobiales bacterium]|nr:IPT/TIG domain-containing protein [Acidimicrobiales bacterium]
KVGASTTPSVPTPIRPLGDELSARLEDELADPFHDVFAGIDGSRSLPSHTQQALARSLSGSPRRGVAPRLAAAAAAVVVLSGAVVGLATLGHNGSGAGSSSRAVGTRQTTGGKVQEDNPNANPRAPLPTGGSSGNAAASAPTAGPYQLATPAPGVPGGAVPVVTSISPDTGPTAGGTWVTIIGSGMSEVSAVHFGAQSAMTFVLVSETELRAQAPAHNPGPVDVIVTGPQGANQPGANGVYTYSG